MASFSIQLSIPEAEASKRFQRFGTALLAVCAGILFIALLVSDAASAAAGMPGMAVSLRGPLAPMLPSPAANRSASALAGLRARLATERERVGARFSAPALAASLVRGAGASAVLGARLTAAVLDGAPFVVGVTGGSSTAGNFSWPPMLQAWLRSKAVGAAKAEVRNAGQGTTSQLVTAPCIHALVGDGVDLLLWEFAMNDEYAHIIRDKEPIFPIRRRAAEAYIRQAAQLNPAAMGFVHIWDIGIHDYDGGPNIPNKPFSPTNAVAAYYAPLYDRYFAFDTIGAMWNSGLYSNKKTFLRDAHHPNEFGYGVIQDLLALSILVPWIAYLDAFAPLSPRPPSAATVAASVRAYPMLTPVSDGLFLPGERTLSHCYMAMSPQFSDPAAGALQAVHEPDCSHTTNLRGCDPTINKGKSDAKRDDRQFRFLAANCTGGGAAGGMLFKADVRRIAAVLVDCGHENGNYCLTALDVFLDNKLILVTHASNDILSGFYKWAHKINAAALANTSSHSLRVCARADVAYFSRIVVLEQF